MIYDVIERDARYWLRLDGGGALIGPFEDESAAREWLHGFAGDHRDITVHRERKRKARIHVVGELVARSSVR